MKKALASLALSFILLGCPPPPTAAPTSTAPVTSAAVESDLDFKRQELHRREREFFNTWADNKPRELVISETHSFPLKWDEIYFRGDQYACRTRIPDGWLVVFYLANGRGNSCTAIIVSDTAGVWNKELQRD